VIAHLSASLPFHFRKIFAFYLLYSCFIGFISIKERKRKTVDCEANRVEAD